MNRTLFFAVSMVLANISVAFSQPGGTPDLNAVTPNSLRLTCPTISYTPDPDNDVMKSLLAGRNKYRLVIGAGEFLEDPGTNYRKFVEPTAELIDGRLAELGYNAISFAEIPNLKDSPNHYISGKYATKDNVRAALREMAAATKGGDYGIVYYVGHGNISPGGDDVVLSVYDREVNEDDGYHYGDIIGELSAGMNSGGVKDIPHMIIILDNCFSGTVSKEAHVEVSTTGGSSRLVEIAGIGPIVPEQFALLTATASGANSDAYGLAGTAYSAFGLFFARALKEDWDCADQVHDGILTLSELKAYLQRELQAASKSGSIAEPMEPQVRPKDDTTFLVFRPDKYSVDGIRYAFDNVKVAASAGTIATLTFPNGGSVSCANSNGCTFPVSKVYEDSPVTLSVTYAAQMSSSYSPSDAFGDLFTSTSPGTSAASSFDQATKDTDLMRRWLQEQQQQGPVQPPPLPSTQYLLNNPNLIITTNKVVLNTAKTQPILVDGTSISFIK